MSAFRSLYEAYRDRTYSLACYVLGDSLQAEDALQSIFLKVHRSLPAFRNESSFATWLYRIAVNECQDRLRKQPEAYVPLEDIIGSGAEFDGQLLPDELHAQSERQRVIQEALLLLSPKLRSVVVLKYLEGLSYEEIAQVLECSAGTVASRLNRALVELEARLRPLKGMI
ncbi:MAG: RNA polymerase sigma factor [Blastocatellia bacterium]|nr:RNA polymerase sigma factor [Blastocatellia bacterium]